MFGKRLAVGVLVATFGVAGLGVFSNSYGQSSETAEPGVTYGGVRDFEWVWLRLDASRHVVLALEVPWAASGRRCSDGRSYANVLWAGAEFNSQTISIRSDGTFKKTVVDRYRDAGTRYVEAQTVKGTLTDDRVTGTIEGNSKRTKPNGKVVRCTFGPLRWTAVD
jgi:hypothetical protein